jgi:hypothetical protein
LSASVKTFDSDKLFYQMVIKPEFTMTNVTVNQTSFNLAILSLLFVSIDENLQ